MLWFLSLVSDHYELASDWSKRTTWLKYWPLIGQCLSTLLSDWLVLVTPVAEGSSVVMTFTHKLVGLGFVIIHFKEFMISGIQLRRFVYILQHIISYPGLNLKYAPLVPCWYSGIRMKQSEMIAIGSFQIVRENCIPISIIWNLFFTMDRLETSKSFPVSLFECESFKETVNKTFQRLPSRIIFTVSVVILWSWWGFVSISFLF